MFYVIAFRINVRKKPDDGPVDPKPVQGYVSNKRITQ
jgi:hypothetical protein